MRLGNQSRNINVITMIAMQAVIEPGCVLPFSSVFRLCRSTSRGNVRFVLLESSLCKQTGLCIILEVKGREKWGEITCTVPNKEKPLNGFSAEMIYPESPLWGCWGVSVLSQYDKGWTCSKLHLYDQFLNSLTFKRDITLL